MNKEKYIYHSPEMRHRLKFSLDILKHPQIETFFEIKQKKWFGSVWREIKNRRLDLQLRPDPPDNIFHGLNPMKLSYAYWGSLEIWDERTFDLNKRLKAVYEEYCLSRQLGDSASISLIKQMKKA